MGLAKDGARPIVQKFVAYADYPFEAIDHSTLELFVRASSHVPHSKRSCGPVIKSLECFLQVTEQRLDLALLTSPKFAAMCKQFVGALYSDHFVVARTKLRYTWAKAFLMLLECAKIELPELVIPVIEISTTGPTDFVKSYQCQFEGLALNSEKVWLWQGWPSTNRSGRTSWLPLYFVYVRLGKEFTEHLYRVCDEYYSGRKAQRIVGLSELVRFIHQYPEELSKAQFARSSFVTQFWRDFYRYYMRIGHSAGVEIAQLTVNWRNEFVFFAKEYLVQSGLFAKQYGELPSLRIGRKFGHQTNVKSTSEGIEVKTKLITHIPLNITDSEAMEILFKQIEEDFDLITKWASWATEDIWKRYLRRIDLAPHGRVRKVMYSPSFIRYESDEDKQRWINNQNNPQYLQNISATFAHYGYMCSGETGAVGLLFPPPRDRVAYELALPSTGSLLPHCVLLVARHPKITPSFLENFELFDKHGQRTGFHEIDAGFVLDGRKDRSGPLEGQQVIILTSETTDLVLQIIALTEPLRAFLKARGDDNWRYLLLTCGEGFGYPRRIRRLASDTSIPERLEALANSLGNTSSLPHVQRLEYVRRFSLPALRAQAGVLIYLKERSARKMAEALGHKEYSPDLLDRYLPRPIKAFFQERWIRIFQTGIVVEALKDSPHLLRASGFTHMAELNQFLQHHVLKKLEVEPEDGSRETKKGRRNSHDTSQSEVMFGVNLEILTALLGLQAAVHAATAAVSGKAKYWAEITKRLVGFIESEFCIRPDLKAYLTEAKAVASPQQFAEMIYE